MSELEQVDLLASGYEWECPVCEDGATHTEDCIPKDGKVACLRCNSDFLVSEPLHAL